MWSRISSRPSTFISMRRITLFVSAIIMALFATVTALSAPVAAQTPAIIDAAWNGDAITYRGDSYERVTTVPDVAICENADFAYVHNAGDGDTTEGAHVLCFDSDDRSARTTANFGWFPNATSNGGSVEYGEVQDQRSVTIGAEGEEVTPETDPGEATTTSCDSTYTKGIGWIVCPVTNFLAAGMDWLFDVIKGFLTVQPLSTNQNSGIYVIWGFMRNIANILFVAAFMVIIYSQTTSFGLSSYGIKRLLPRLIMSAILVNVSYWIASIAIDLSNILGVSLQDMFVAMRGSIVMPGTETAVLDMQEIPWATVAIAALAGGGVVYGVMMAGVGASIIMLLPVLLGVIMSALVAILVLAGRQALITVLVILSPLAFVAYLLPNTEKYFHKWKDLFMTMLLVFPLFSIVFGGAQLASAAIIYNAGGNGDQAMSVIILGLAVQVIPLAITPFLISISGTLLGRLAGITNNPNKGVIDRARKLAEKDAAHRSARRLAEGRGLGVNMARRINDRGRKKEALTKAYETDDMARYTASRDGMDAHTAEHVAGSRKTISEKIAAAHYEDEKARNAGLRSLDIQERTYTDAAERAAKRSSNIYEDIKAAPVGEGRDTAGAIRTITGITDPGDAVALNSIIQHAQYARETSQQMRAETYHADIAQQAQETRTHELLGTDPSTIADINERRRVDELRIVAGNALIDEQGPERITNIVQEKEATARTNRVNAAGANLDRNDATVEEKAQIILKEVPASGRFASFPENIDSRSAAVRKFVPSTNMKELHRVLAEHNTTETASADDVIITSELAAAVASRKPLYLSETHRNEMAENKLAADYRGETGQFKMLAEQLNTFVLDAETMVTTDQDDLEMVLNLLDSGYAVDISGNAHKQIKGALELAFDDNRYAGRMKKNRGNLNKLREKYGLDQRFE